MRLKRLIGFLEVGGGVTMKLSAEEWPLIQPSEMQVIVPPVHTAESVRTSLGMHKLKCNSTFTTSLLSP